MPLACRAARRRTTAALPLHSYKDAIRNVPNGHAIGFMPFDTSDGLKLSIGASTMPMSSGSLRTRQYLRLGATRIVGARWSMRSHRVTLNRYRQLSTSPEQRPSTASRPSDAHSFKGTAGDNDKTGIRSVPFRQSHVDQGKTRPFEAYLQAIMEPARNAPMFESGHRSSLMFS